MCRQTAVKRTLTTPSGMPQWFCHRGLKHRAIGHTHLQVDDTITAGTQIGWQGRSLLIVSPDYGPIHRLIAILTNMHLDPDRPLKNQCKNCTVCIDKCPKESLTLCQFDDHPNSRRDVLDISSCLGDNGCMVCILKCPYL